MIVLAAICRSMTILYELYITKIPFSSFLRNAIYTLYAQQNYLFRYLLKKGYTKFADAHSVCVLNRSDRERKRGLL